MSYHFSSQQPSLDERPNQQPIQQSPQQSFQLLNQQQQQPPHIQVNQPHQKYQYQQPQQVSEIQWNNNYQQNQIPQLIPKLSNTDYSNITSNRSPYSSPTHQFKNPWYGSQQSPLLAHTPLATANSSSQPSSAVSSTPTSATFLQQTPTRTSYNSHLPTTYEYDDMNIEARKNSLILPPSRVGAPPPTQQQLQQQSQQQQYLYPQHFSDASVHLNNDLHRRQSIAAVQYNNNNGNNNGIRQQQQQQPQFFNSIPRRQSYFQHLKQLPAPQMRKVHKNKNELKPTINKVPKYRRASMVSNYISPLLSLTTELTTTYSLCNPTFHYEVSKNPKRVLTKPNEGVTNNGFDNCEDDYILYVNDVLGLEEKKKYLVLDILGQGTFAQVVKCQNLTTKELVAVKVVKSKPAYINQSLSEVSLLELINNKIDPLDKHHFLRMKDKFVHKNHLCLVFELLSSNLFELVKQNNYEGLSIKLVRNFTKQLLDSLCVLKDSKIIHCDLKPENILLISPDKPDIKVVDFGSACQERETLYTYIQSRFYRSPEVILGLPYTSSIDTWSLGCIIAELFLGLPLFPGNSQYDQLSKIIATLGLPASWMIEMGKNSKIFLEKVDKVNENEKTRYVLKSIEKYSKERNIDEKPGKQYFSTTKLDELIINYKMNRKTMTSSMIEKEIQERKSLVHLLIGLLNLNPLERWTPQQAILHPFITEQKFNGDWCPPGTGLKLRKLHSTESC